MEQDPQNISHGWDAWDDAELPPVAADDVLSNATFSAHDEPPRQIAHVPKVVLAAALTQFSLPLSLADLPVMAATLDNQPPRKTIVSAGDVGLFDAQPPGVPHIVQQNAGQGGATQSPQAAEEVPPSFSMDATTVQAAGEGSGVSLQPAPEKQSVARRQVPAQEILPNNPPVPDTNQLSTTSPRHSQSAVPVQKPVVGEPLPPVPSVQATPNIRQNSPQRAQTEISGRTHELYRPREGGAPELVVEDENIGGQPPSGQSTTPEVQPEQLPPDAMPVLPDTQREVTPQIQSVDPNNLAMAGNQGLLNQEMVKRAPLVAPNVTAPTKTGSGGAVYDQLLSFIAQGEGGYNSMNQGTSHGQIVGSTNNASEILGKNLTDMTLSEVVAAQRDGQLFAAGRYQIIPGTMQRALGYTGMELKEKFSEANQDKLAISLMMHKRPILGQYLKGDTSVSTRDAMVELALEWASAPDPDTGNSMYGDGNRAQHSVKETQIALETARKAISGQ